MSWRTPLLLLLLTGVPPSIHAQMIDDGLMMPGKTLCTGFLYGHDHWSEYWEGTLTRDNENVGTLTTQSVTWMGTYGFSSRLNVIAMLPYVSTSASAGTLAPQDGVQDLTVAVKGRLFEEGIGAGSLRAFGVASYGMPVSDYVADIMPLSIGLQSKRFSGRLTTHYRMERGFFADATGAYTWRGNVTLDRPAYYTEGQLFLTDQVAMPDVFDYTLRAGYLKGAWLIPVSYTRQDTQGGGDIRRQDMPFVSNRMNFSKLEARAKYILRRPAGLSFEASASRILSGRNVGESTILGAGITYIVGFSGKPAGDNDNK